MFFHPPQSTCLCRADGETLTHSGNNLSTECHLRSFFMTLWIARLVGNDRRLGRLGRLLLDATHTNIFHFHSPGLVCQLSPPMNIFLQKKNEKRCIIRIHLLRRKKSNDNVTNEMQWDEQNERLTTMITCKLNSIYFEINFFFHYFKITFLGQCRLLSLFLNQSKVIWLFILTEFDR